MERAAKVAWALALTYVFIAIGSAMGDGTGPLGLGFMTHLIWSYAMLILGGALALWILLRPKNPEAGPA